MFGFLASAVSLLALTPLASAYNASISARTSGWTQETCATVSGRTALGWQYNFGCLCTNDVGTWCQQNNIPGYLQSYLDSYIAQHGSSKWYPTNSQPTCDGKGGYSCGSLGQRSDGTCGSTSCPAGYCSSNGVCCPRGTSWQNGQCCGNSGCKNSGNKCQPAYGCSTFTSNGVCCQAGAQKSWQGCQSICCPAGQVEKNGQCTCPTGFTVDPKDSTKCNSNCPTGASFQNGKCACTNTQQQITTVNGQQQCTNICPDGASYTGGKCVCTNNQQQLTTVNGQQQCTNICTQSGWSYDTTGKQCCPSGSSVQNGQCTCTQTGYKMTGSGNSRTCTNQCVTGHSWCKTRCCKSYMTEDNSGNCVCPQSGYTDNGSSCSPSCDTAHGYTYQTGKWGKGMCCAKGKTACQTVCCPVGQEEVGSSGICCANGSSLGGTDGKQCVAPSGKSKRQALAGRMIGEQVVLNKVAPSYGIESNKAGALCPKNFAACPIPGRPQAEYECLNTLEDLQSCGGCTSMGTGQDCTAIRGAKWMGCVSGQCEVYSCQKGWRQVNGTSCERN